MKNRAGLRAAQAAGVVGLVLLAGCLSTHPGSSSLAYVDIVSHGEEDVRAETIRVFEDEDYRLVQVTPSEMIFERPATQRERVLYGSYGAAPVATRVVVAVEPRRQGGCLLRSDAYTLREGFVDKLPRMSRRPYQDLLNRVKASFVTTE